MVLNTRLKQIDPNVLVRLGEVISYLRDDHYMQKAEASRYVALSIRTLESHIDEIPHYRIGGRILFKRSELDSWVQRHRERETDVDLDRLTDDVLAAVMR